MNNDVVLHDIWAKTSSAVMSESWIYPLVLHMIDVALAADIIAKQWRIQWSNPHIHTLMMFVCGAHDIGKAIPQFQRKHDVSYEKLRTKYDFVSGALTKPHGTGMYIPHGYASFAILNAYLVNVMQLPRSVARWLARAVAGHHGSFPTASDVKLLKPHTLYLGTNATWENTRIQLLDTLAHVVAQDRLHIPTVTVTHADMIILAGLTSVADWVASQSMDVDWQRTYLDVPTFVAQAYKRLEHACMNIAWHRDAISPNFLLTDVLPRNLTPRPLQVAVADLMHVHQSRLVLIEAPTGEGKTEASYIVAVAHALKNNGYLSAFFALPTQATSNQMYKRILAWLQHTLNIANIPHLVHSGNAFSDDYTQAQQTYIYDRDDDLLHNGIQAESWFMTTKRILLAAYGVGTLDQALMGVLRTKHGFVRLTGLAGKIVIVDEVHAYDVYTSTLLDNLLQWLNVLGCTVVLLSATLPATRRRQLLNAWGVTLIDDAHYPRLIGVDRNGGIQQQTINSAQVDRRVQLRRVDAHPNVIAQLAVAQTMDGGIALVICNTVTRSQEIYRIVAQLLKDVDCQILLLHSRMTNRHRMHIEQQITSALGRGGQRPARMIVIGTQVLEQSLDIDADVLMSDHAPIDLLIQRMGRLHRHTRDYRPEMLRIPTMYVAMRTPQHEGKTTTWFGDYGLVYDASVLLRTYIWLEMHSHIAVPADIECAIDDIYERRLNPIEFQAQLLQADQELDYLMTKKTWASTAQLWGVPTQSDELFDGGNVVMSDDEDASHQLRPRTRDGDPSITVLCVEQVATMYKIKGVEISLTQAPTRKCVKDIFLPATMKVSARSLIWRIKQGCQIPASWQKTTGLRDVYVLCIKSDGTTNIPQVHYTNELGLYTTQDSIEEEVL